MPLLKRFQVSFVVSFRAAVAAFSLSVTLITVPLVSRAEAPKGAISLRTLRSKPYGEACKARDRADLMRAQLDASQAKLEPSDRLQKKGVSDKQVEEIIQAYRAVIDKYPHTEIAAYSTLRLAGFHQHYGKSEDAEKLLKEAVEEYLGTSEEARMCFSAGLFFAQARKDPSTANRYFSRIPKPEVVDPRDPQTLEANSIYRASEEQLKSLGLQRLSPEEVNASEPFVRKSVPQVRTDDEIKAQTARNECDDLVKRLARLQRGAELDRVQEVLVAHGAVAVQAIERSLVEESVDSVRVHWSVVVLREINSVAARNLLRRIALGDFEVTNPNLQRWAGQALVQQDRDEAWELLSSSTPQVLTLALNSVQGRPIPNGRIEVIKKKVATIPDDFTRWRAIEILLLPRAGRRANEAGMASIEEALSKVSKIAGGDKLVEGKMHFETAHTVSELHYGRYMRALIQSATTAEELQKLAGRLEGTAQRVVWLALAYRGEQSARAEILKIVNDRDAGMLRAWAVTGLGLCGNSDDVPLLRKLLESDPLVRNGPLPPPQGLGAVGPMHPVRAVATDAITRIEQRATKK